AIIFNTFDELEEEVLEAIRAKYNRVYTIGPIQLLEKEIYEQNLKSIGSNLWKEDMECLNWLDQRKNDSVLYINFGSITPLSPDQKVEFAWGLAKSNHHFLWIIRPDLMNGKGSILPEGFLEETKGRGLMVGWCPQEQVLAHPAIGGFLTHCGWNSTIETISEGVPMVCWPFFAEQQTNCRYACKKWDIGVEIEGNVTRGKVEKMVRVMMEGEKGKEMRKKALEWEEKAQLAAKHGGSSYQNLEKLILETLLNNHYH
ncbi:7-deoxyloganetin glucosyltransferase-like, partial [Olea europaea var. sylvestris]|uniref:7-deoxyloganetin glucosyltransferase-like n=1 Tax=Olea europaea var. sylvestris TaxID=158386 RepID=UPI000C1D0559